MGDGPLRDFVQTACDERPWCKSVGAKTGRDKAQYLAIADVLLNPGLVGLNILDAFVAGVPMVTTDCHLHSPEIAYLSNGRNGLITENTINSFVSGVQSILGDDNYRDRLKIGCHQAGEHYTIENMAKKFQLGILQALES